MEDRYWKFKEKAQNGVVGHLDLPGGRSPKEEEEDFWGFVFNFVVFSYSFRLL